MKKKLIVVGNGMVGYKFCEKLVQKSMLAIYDVVVFGEEIRPAYDRVHLSEYFATKDVEKLTMAPTSWYASQGIDLVLGDPVVNIDRSHKTIQSHKGQQISYDVLIMATGSSAFVPSIPGVEKDGIFVYRTIEDLDMMMSYAQKCTIGTVIGGGLLGLEAAKAVLDLRLKAHVVEFAPRLMPRQLDQAGSDMLKAKVESLGVEVLVNKNTQCFTGGEKVTGLQFVDGQILSTDMVVISAGIKPRDELARTAGLEVGTRGGIVVNDALQTSDPNIYAIGECALHQGMIYGLVAPGYDMADVVIAQLQKGEKQFQGFDMSTKLKLIGVDVASFGDPFVAEPHAKTIVLQDSPKGVYKRINITNDGQQLLGGILVGDASAYNMLLQTVKNKTILPPHPEDLILGARGGSESSHSVLSLPDEAIICSCESVTKGMLCGAMEEQGVTTFDQMKACTKAGTGCGGCVPMVKDIIQESLKAKGAYIRNVLCEHFDYSRQELFDLVKINGWKTYSEILDNAGKGHGCEVCKPAVASIVASIYNEMILKQDFIQDSNDRYLANIQKNGTYSVVPRIPGGEITPEKLIVLGEVAKKYGLYTKITGGQRIDLFGAHVGDLPDIWEELIAHGFESGHAYGKALRTVKSCVGSTWCRFGVQDSVSFAIEIEERYRGLRAPHKLKSAVSGCVRECAEAQSKDFGMIATEKGYNLFVCGNGGSKPQHALLLASDIDEKTVIKYLDRFLMFYIKTADPLTRTAPWLQKMEGGISYLRAVVVDDVLGIGEQLEKEMEFMVETYRCEWKEVVENPELRKRFTHFVNTKEKDPTVKFESLRGQIKAAEWVK